MTRRKPWLLLEEFGFRNHRPSIVRASRRAPLVQRHDRYDVTLAVSTPSPYRSVEFGVRKCTTSNQDILCAERAGTESGTDLFH
ncbi:hypothetical protein Rhow_002811 [Rhodococcus wratislaviensis]|uniref:Uncharacterized protein n=1 Tax=Rhodococcus wratislaviensis TaxID=44752 RepID=A0A402C6Y4_RHOWR|nr:hypothetical protein Rhow_002811 [Rhodococcus wratislaviensis]